MYFFPLATKLGPRDSTRPEGVRVSQEMASRRWAGTLPLELLSRGGCFSPWLHEKCWVQLGKTRPRHSGNRAKTGGGRLRGTQDSHLEPPIPEAKPLDFLSTHISLELTVLLAFCV